MLNDVTRTTATATVIIPAAAKLGEKLHINPLLLVIPIAISCAYAFVVPIGTTATALTYNHGKMKIPDMVCN